MTSANSQWDATRNEYLAKIEQALQDAPGSERKQILGDVTFHLDKRFDELGPEEQTWENIQQIITEMGPVEDYAELLDQPIKQIPKRFGLGFWIITFGVLAVLLTALFMPALPSSLFEAKRPCVVETSPETLSTDVDSGTTEIKVTFDWPMMNFSWSWVGGGEHYPETSSEPRYNKERRTCTLPVKLEPGHWYWIGINSEYFVYFQTEKHVPAKPYVILFATADESGNPTQIPDEYIEEAKRINSE